MAQSAALMATVMALQAHTAQMQAQTRSSKDLVGTVCACARARARAHMYVCVCACICRFSDLIEDGLKVLLIG